MKCTLCNQDEAYYRVILELYPQGIVNAVPARVLIPYEQLCINCRITYPRPKIKINKEWWNSILTIYENASIIKPDLESAKWDFVIIKKHIINEDYNGKTII